jgi:1,4-alpha-glucan branching enzyme
MAKPKSKPKALSKPMTKTVSEPKIKRRRITFSYEAGSAREVALMGDFNHWNPKKNVMKNNGKGTWSRIVMLTPGRYEYKFFVDGVWTLDPQNSQTCSNCFGTRNNVLSIENR